MVSLIQHFEADFLWKVSLKILNLEIILKTFSHVKIYAASEDPLQTVSLHKKGKESSWVLV